jgi:hypothetical protein
MFNMFTAFQITLVASAICFVCGVVFSQKIKDWVRGVPSDLRTALGGVETNALGAVKAAQMKVLAEIGAAVPAVKPPAPPVVVVPAAPAAPISPDKVGA